MRPTPEQTRLLEVLQAEVFDGMAAGRVRRDQLLQDFARWKHDVPSLHLPLRLRTRELDQCHAAGVVVCGAAPT